MANFAVGYPIEKPPGYELLESNLRAHRRPALAADTDIPVCSCQPAALGGGGCGPGSQCLNRLSHIECSPASCPCGPDCDNQAMQTRRMPQTRCVHMGDKGWGVAAAEDILPGTFVMEYIGEVVNLEEAERRAAQYEKAGLQHTYVMTLSAKEVIDATRKAGPARFINHSCAPNCATEKWLVAGQLCVGIFARGAIVAGAEITYDYRLAWNGGKRVKCCCGADACLGFLGAHARSFREQLAEEAAGQMTWADQDGLHYALDLTLDDFDSEDEAAAKGSARPAVSAASREARALLDGWEAPGGRGAKAGKKRRARPGKAGSKKGRRGSPEGSPAAGVADELELDTAYVIVGDVDSSSSVPAGSWEACGSSRVRLLARVQAHASAQAQLRSVAQGIAAGQDGGGQVALRSSTALLASMHAVEELLREFEDTHAKLSSFAEPLAQSQLSL